MSLNKIMLIGHLGSDPEKRTTQSGSTVASFSLATSDSYKDSHGEKQEVTTWHKIVLWNKLAELAVKYLAKGKQVYIEGSIKNNEWNDKDGNKRITTEVTGATIQFLDPSTQGQSSGKHGQNNDANGYPKNSQSQYGSDHSKNQNSNNIDDDFIEDDIF